MVILKSGANEASARAARSHTGALAGSAPVYRSLFRQKGIIEVQSIGEMAAVDLPVVEDILLKVALLAESWPDLVELDINPLIVLPEGRCAFVVDAMAAAAGDACIP